MIPEKDGKDLAYYEQREKNMARKVELNDKLKAVHLIKALGVDDNHKRDILAKVNFNKEPKKVYEDTKTAIRDICGENYFETVTEDKEDKASEVLVVKPWQEKKSDNNRPDFSRSRSRDNSRQGRIRDRTYRSYSRDRSGSRDRSYSRGRSHRRSSVSFQEKKGGRDYRRDTTPGMSPVNILNETYYRIYINEEFINKSKEFGQFMIVDCGCPRSLMGDKEYANLSKSYNTEVKSIRNNERFRFGPSKIYESEFKAKVPMKVGDFTFNAEFFVVKGNIPMLLGNDVMKPLEGSINLKTKELELKKVNKSIKMEETSGGHYIIPIKSVAVLKPSKDAKLAVASFESIKGDDNMKGDEAEVVMLILLAESENKDDIENIHKGIGHTAFVGLALTLDEEAQVNKVHRYFGHRSGRRVWELFAKAEKLKGKRPEVLEVIDKCKICSQMKKSPPRPKVGLPVSNDFNDVVGLDLKVLDKNKGEYILWIVDLFSKMIKGKFIRDKKPATVIQAIIETWIVGGGSGPGHPRRGFWSDNGGEFLNDEMINFAASLDIHIKMTAADAPWQNGVVERHHATADIIYEKMMSENHEMLPQEAIDFASFAKNSEINQTRFSALHLMMGQNPNFPGLAEANPASSNLKSSNKYMKTLRNIDDARVKVREIECNNKLKKVMGEKINPNVEKAYKI